MKVSDIFEDNDDPFAETDPTKEMSDEQQLNYWKDKEAAYRYAATATLRARREYRNRHGIYDRYDTHVTSNIQAFARFTVLDPRHSVSEFFIDNSQQNEIPTHITQIERLLQKTHKWNISIDAAMKKQSAIKKRINAKIKADAGKVRDSTEPVTIPEDQVPQKLSTTGKNGFQNPYFLSKVGRYAGDLDHYPWASAQMVSAYNQLKEILEQHGIAPFTVIYGGLMLNHGSKYANFAAVAGNGKLIWRKYDAGGGSGQNWIIIGGKNMKTSSVLHGGKNDPKIAQFLSGAK